MLNPIELPDDTIMLVHHQISRGRKSLALKFPMGVSLPVTLFDIRDWKCAGEGMLPLRGPIIIYLAASRRFHSHSFLLLWDKEAGCFSCSCPERNSVGTCPHADWFVPLKEEEEW